IQRLCRRLGMRPPRRVARPRTLRRRTGRRRAARNGGCRKTRRNDGRGHALGARRIHGGRVRPRRRRRTDAAGRLPGGTPHSVTYHSNGTMNALLKYMSAATLAATFSAGILPAHAGLRADSAAAAVRTPLPPPATGYANRTGMRSEFMSYTIRENAMNDDRASEWNYLPVTDFVREVRADG